MRNRTLSFLVIVLFFQFCYTNAQVDFEVSYEDFLSQQDMLWDRTPENWQVSPYTGNGNIGFLLYQIEGDAKNTIALHVGRHDYYDHRLPHEGQQMLWIYRCRLPLGHFKLESKGDIVGVDLRLDLWNAELIGEIKTSKGSYAIHGLTHTNRDIIYFETKAKDGESINISWHPDVPFSSVREELNNGGGPKGGYWDAMRNAPYPLPPKYTLSEEDGMQFCLQPLYDNRGETTTGWEINGDAAGKQLLVASIHHSFPEHNSMEIVEKNLLAAREMLFDQSFFSSHRKWWHDYYPQSFLSINDTEKEAFYWIQMYKFASATRGNGPILDLMGPWYNKTFWPMVWGDLNVQLIYWTHLAANRLEAGESLVNNVDKYSDNLANNAPSQWEDCATLGALLPQDMDSKRELPDFLVWILHDYWLHCQFAGDRDRMRDGLFPILRQAVNSYRNYFKDNPVEAEDGKIHFKYSWSPEYKPGYGQDINFSLGLVRWSCQTLLDLNKEFDLEDPLASEWQHIIDNLVEFQTDENGLRIGKDIPFDLPHRHYSHLLAFYPFAVITPEDEAERKLIQTSVDHWLDVTIGKQVTGYTCTGAASMYAWLGDGDESYKYLDMFIKHRGVSPTTMYAEVGYYPVIESPFSYATSMHDMLLQSWGGKLRVFSGVPGKWSDIAFKDLRGQGAFLVSAKKKAGITQFVTVKSLIGSPCIVQTDIPNPRIYINGKEVTNGKKVYKNDLGQYQIDLKKGEYAVLTPVSLSKTDLKIEAIPVSPENKNLFGLHKKTEKLPGHQYYYRNDKLRK